MRKMNVPNLLEGSIVLVGVRDNCPSQLFQLVSGRLPCLGDIFVQPIWLLGDPTRISPLSLTQGSLGKPPDMLDRVFQQVENVPRVLSFIEYTPEGNEKRGLKCMDVQPPKLGSPV